MRSLVIAVLMLLVFSVPVMACEQPPVYDVSASITSCGDPRAVISLVNDGDLTRDFTVRFLNAHNVQKTAVISVAEGRERIARRWVLGRSIVSVYGEKGELLAREIIKSTGNCS